MWWYLTGSNRVLKGFKLVCFQLHLGTIATGVSPAELWMGFEPNTALTPIVGMVGFEPTTLLYPKQAGYQAAPHPVMAGCLYKVQPAKPTSGWRDSNSHSPESKSGGAPLPLHPGSTPIRSYTLNHLGVSDDLLIRPYTPCACRLQRWTEYQYFSRPNPQVQINDA